MMGLAYDELYDLTPRSFNNRLTGFLNHQEQQTQNNWEQTRMVVHSCLSPHLKKSQKPTEIMPFPWDSKSSQIENKVVISDEKRLENIERHKQVILKKLNK